MVLKDRLWHFSLSLTAKEVLYLFVFAAKCRIEVKML